MAMTSSAPAESSRLNLSLGEVRRRIEDFEREYLKDKSPETVGTYRRALNEFERWFVRQKGRFQFTRDGIESYKAYLMKERELSQVSVSTYLTAIRRLCQYLTDIGLLDENPARDVKGNRRPGTHSRAVLTESEIEKLIDSLDITTQIGLRDRAIIFLMLYAGLSEIEVIRANVKDIDHTLLGHFLRVQGKGRRVKDQQVPIDQNVMDAIQAYLESRGRVRPDEPLFVSHGHRSEGERLNTRSVRSRINEYLSGAGVKRRGVTPHSLTHTAALIWLNDGMSIDEVQRRMRHGTLDTTMIYYRKQGLLKRDPDELKEILGS